MAFLNQDEVLEVIQAIIDSGLDITANRDALFQFVNLQFLATLASGGMPNARLMNDIGRMNSIERLSNGDIPLQTYLRNVSFLLSGTPEEKIIRLNLDKVIHRSSGASGISEPDDLPETKEKIIFTDDMVTFAFMEGGVKAAEAVLKLLVPRFENGVARTLSNGRQMMYLGTGWLLTDSLMITNHHVINARNEGEPNALEADFKLQGQGTTAQLDFDAEALVGTEINVSQVEAWNAELDYTVLRIPATGRTPLRLSAETVQLGIEPIPVNIIQHPGGRSKRYGIRNNLVSAANATELRYFTDTESGSSGSPVFNDQWEVVALHRASTYVSSVQFQGKTTAYVNLGTQLTAIINDLRLNHKTLADEIPII